MQSKTIRRWLWPLAVVAVILVGVAVIQPAFGGDQPAFPQPDAVAALPVAAPGPAEGVQAELQPSQPSVSQETQTETTPVADTPSSENCIACHTNQALLQQLAVEPEKVESELAAGEG